MKPGEIWKAKKNTIRTDGQEFWEVLFFMDDSVSEEFKKENEWMYGDGILSRLEIVEQFEKVRD